MSQVIRISDDLYRRLEEQALGFDTPSNVIERILNAYEGISMNSTGSNDDSVTKIMQPANSLDIVYVEASEEAFKQQLLIHKKAYIKLFYTDSTSEIKEWNASRFTGTSHVDGNLRSGYLRGWRERGICKAVLSVNREQL